MQTEQITKDNVTTSTDKLVLRYQKEISLYFKTYLKGMKDTKSLSHIEFRILTNALYFLEYNTNKFYLDETRREELAAMCDLAVVTVNQAFSRLVKKKFIIKLGANLYAIDPDYYFNGEEEQKAIASKAIQTIVIKKMKGRELRKNPLPKLDEAYIDFS